jgi:hypothetical protein
MLNWEMFSILQVEFEICIITTAWRQRNNKHFLQVVFLQDYVNFKTFLRTKRRLKEWSKIVDVNEGKFVFNIDVLFVL